MDALLASYHTHTHFSDGTSTPEEFVTEALKKRFKSLGFTEHSPLPFENSFSFKQQRKQEYLSLIRDLKLKYYGEIDIFHGLEMDFIPGMSQDFSLFREEYQCDYLIGSVHLVGSHARESLWFIDGPRFETYDQGVRDFFGGDIRKAVKAYFQQLNLMILTQDFEILGHFDKIKMHNKGRYFSEDEKWYCDLVDESLDLIRQKELIVEVNTRGIYKKRSETTYPGPEILRKINRMGIPVMVNSDAHQPHELDGAYETVRKILEYAGIRCVMTLNAASRSFGSISLG